VPNVDLCKARLASLILAYCIRVVKAVVDLVGLWVAVVVLDFGFTLLTEEGI